MSTAPDSSTGNFISENYVIPEEPEKMQEFLKQTLENIARFINRKDTAQYETIEVQNNQTFPGTDPQNKKQAYRKIFEFADIAVGATLNILHNITNLVETTKWSGNFITAADERPLPYADEAVVTNQVSVKRIGANYVIINGATAPAIISGRLIVDFLKN